MDAMHGVEYCKRQFIFIFTLHTHSKGVTYEYCTVQLHRTGVWNFVPHINGEGGPGSSVGIGTDYGLDGPGSNPSRDEIFRPSRPALGPTQSPVKWVPGLSRG